MQGRPRRRPYSPGDGPNTPCPPAASCSWAVIPHWDLARGGWVVPGIALPIPHPVYPPWYHTRPRTPLHAHTTTVHHTPRARTYGRFWIPVGEPRGVEYRPSLGSQAGIILYLEFTRPFDWNLDLFYTVFTEFRTLFY